MPELLVLLGRVLLAGLFTVSGVAKLASRARTRESLVDFGVPKRLAAASADFLILCELAVAALLLPLATFGYGGIGALALLTVFSAAIAFNLLRNRKPNCNCFGQLHSAPIGWSTFARNVVLGAIACLVALGARDPRAVGLLDLKLSFGAAEPFFASVSLLSFVLLIAVSAVLVLVMRQQGRMLLRLEAIERSAGIRAADTAVAAPLPQVGVPLGTTAPAFELADLNGGRSSLSALLQAQKPVMLLFSNAGCGPCQALLPEIARWQQNLADSVTLAVIAGGTAAENREKLEPFGIKTVLIQQEREVAESYQAWGTPAAVVVDASGDIASYVAQGGDAIRNLVRTMFARREAPSVQAAGVALGEPAPDLSFQSLAGKSVALSDFRGKETLLLFWNPQCGFCQRMLSDLKAWEASAISGAPRLLVISSGSLADNRAMGLRSPVVFDTDSKAAQAFSAGGTPMAVLLDRRGRVASRVAAGAQAFFALAKSREGLAAPLNLAIEES
jgi:thiol-disulfide isomerase/thioredoxin/energy-converting hydrogenase Eha subunit E